MFNIDTLLMTLLDLHCTSTTSFDGSTVYLSVTGIKNAFQRYYDKIMSMSMQVTYL